MERFVYEQNLLHLRKALLHATDEVDRRHIQAMIEQEEAKDRPQLGQPKEL